MYTTTSIEDAEDELVYVMCRPAAGGTILGGQYRANDWNAEFDPNVAQRIARRACEHVPELLQGENPTELEIIQHNVGFRPTRKGGVRVECEHMAGIGNIVHNYGHGGTGYQASYGCAAEVIALVNSTLKP